MLATIHSALLNLLNSYRENRALVVFPGVAFTALGIAAVMSPVLSGVSMQVLLGILLIAAGICRIFFAMHSCSSSATIIGLGLAALSFLTGLLLLILRFPPSGYFTMLLAAYLVGDGIFSSALSLHYRTSPGWGWLLTSSLSTIVLGFMILYKWPSAPATSAVAAVGLFLLLTGAALANLGVPGDGLAE